MSAGQEVATRTPAQETLAQIRSDAFQEQVKLALPDSVPARRFVRATVTALLQNPDVLSATRDSLIQSVIRCAQDGLMPDGREAALVVFNQKVKTGAGEHWEKRVQYMPMIGGYRKIAAEFGWSLMAAVVYENDTFDYELGLEPRLEHRPTRIGMPRGDRIGAYAVAVHKDGRRLFEVLPAEEVGQARQVSRASDRGPWVEWTDRMWEKTAGRRLFGRLPLADEDRVIRLINATEITDPAGSLYGPGATRPLALDAGSAVDSPLPNPSGDVVDGSLADPPVEAADNQGAHGSGDVAEASPAPAPEPDDDPAPEESEDEIKTQAIRASKVKVHFGKKEGKSLGQVYEAGRAAGWFRWLLVEFTPESPEDDRVQRAGWAFCRHALPDVYQEALGLKETS